jgi:hypothetical protein
MLCFLGWKLQTANHNTANKESHKRVGELVGCSMLLTTVGLLVYNKTSVTNSVYLISHELQIVLVLNFVNS